MVLFLKKSAYGSEGSCTDEQSILRKFIGNSLQIKTHTSCAMGTVGCIESNTSFKES
jgi:hypothetical protein